MNGDRVKCNITAGGTGALTLGSAVADHITPAAAAMGDSGFVNYLAQWSGGFATGIGTLSANGLTLTRVREYLSDATTTMVAAAPYRSVPSSGATLSIVQDARSAGQSSFTSVDPQGLRSDECYLAGGGSIGTGSSNSAVFGAGWVDNNCPNSLVLGPGGAFAPWGTSIGSGGYPANQHAMLAESHSPNGQAALRFKLWGVTSNATPADLFCDIAGSIRPAVPAGKVWLIRAFIVAVVSNTSGAIGNVYSRELRLVGKPTGQVGSTVSSAIASDAGFTGSASASVDATGQVKITCTGMAASTINWSAHLEITPTEATP